jgi:putative transposase
VEAAQTYFKSFKFRLDPEEDQLTLLSKHFGCTRFLYNYFLEEKQNYYLQNKSTLNYNACCGALTVLKKQEEFVWLSEVSAQSLQSCLKNLETAFGNFFKKKARFPKFKSKKVNNDTFHCPQNVRVEGNKIFVPKFKEGISLIKHRELKGEIRSATFSKVPSGKMYVSILCELPLETPLKKTGKKIGVDLGLKDFLITSEGQRFANPRFLKSFLKELRKHQKHLCRKQKDSKRKDKQRLKVARLHEKITNSRHNMQHQVSSFLVNNYDVIALESLNVKGMLANHRLAQAISDVAWSGFVSKLEYKAQWFGKEVVRIETFFPSSKTCSCCGHQKSNLRLEEREWTCVSCNTKHDRDINAAKNILQRGITILSSGTDDYRHGAKIRPEKRVKPLKGTSVEMSKKKNVRKYVLKPVGL